MASIRAPKFSSSLITLDRLPTRIRNKSFFLASCFIFTTRATRPTAARRVSLKSVLSMTAVCSAAAARESPPTRACSHGSPAIGSTIGLISLKPAAVFGGRDLSNCVLSAKRILDFCQRNRHHIDNDIPPVLYPHMKVSKLNRRKSSSLAEPAIAIAPLTGNGNGHSKKTAPVSNGTPDSKTRDADIKLFQWIRETLY